jgi:iron(III) transport system substrate-binding protein
MNSSRFCFKSTALASAAALIWVSACSRAETPPSADATREVTIYVSTDRPFAEPVLQAYQKKTGVKVNAVYDTEETKSTGLANRLIAEKARPQADIFWSNEPVRTLVLKRNNVLTPYKSPAAEPIPAAFKDPEGYWTGFSARLRVIGFNTKLVNAAEVPKSVFDLADPKWKNQVAIADPRFGTTSFHVAAIYTVAGETKADEFFRDLKANGVKIVDGNSVVRDMIARGEVKVGLTDTDDANVAIQDKQPFGMVFPDREGIGVPLMPNMVSLIAGAPHPEEGKKLIDFLLSAESERLLASSDAVQIPLQPGVEPPPALPRLDSFKPMTLDYENVADRLEQAIQRLQPILGL